MNVGELYEPMLSRDLEAIPATIHRFRQSHTSHQLFGAVSRFALLAASPSQHGKHALIACVAAKEIEGELQHRYDELVTECAVYAAQARLPWSEPPITDPPPVEKDHPSSLDELRAAIAERNRLRGERWLAARLARGSIAHDFFSMAAEDLSDFGHKLIVAVAVWKMALIAGQPESYPFLRVAIAEWTAYGGETSSIRTDAEPRESLLRELVDDLVASEGGLESFHRVALYDAAVEAAKFAGNKAIQRHVAAFLTQEQLRVSAVLVESDTSELPIYRLARDYAQYLKAFAIAGRMERAAERRRLIAAAKYNRDHAPSFEEWSFA